MCVIRKLHKFNLVISFRHVAFQTIHPAQQRIIEEVRRRLGIGAERREETAAPAAERPAVIYNADLVCPVCFNNARFATLSNCGHIFCCQCIIAYWRYGNWLGAVTCPVCRAKITLLLENFVEADLNETGREEASRNIRDYNRRFSNEPRSWMDYLRDVPVLVPHLLSRLFTLDGLMWMFRMRILLCVVAAALYILSPLDVLPEAVFGLLGILDDVFIALLLLLYLSVAYRRLIVGEE